ncbi:MAG TPA: thioredoxin domain-containing protein [Kiritimatiellia bacterium]|nr:thioredoxin domain-containing protein [Kiritimatiellia bacterium]HMP33916.1 thioredoxin domain-containing protein [Kiritimatiellia bacterium]
MTNRLAHATSPYLHQHAHQPVHWFPWGEEAFAEARSADKPIFLSIGYSSCHWCHVMAHESFDDPTVADLLNRHFIAIKVDREEHPDVDTLYMTATQLMTQRGGWPNSVWLTPDARPWYAGTYFPRDDRPGRIGFISLLRRLADLWTSRREEVEKQADALTAALRKEQQRATENLLPGHQLDPATLVSHYLERFDARFGGFGDAPKFPQHTGLHLLLQVRALHRDHPLDLMIERTLDAMARGGLYDQIGGGFHRYATDERWFLPHFEKMLCDNALLLGVYARALATYHRPRYRRIVRETAAWLDRELSHPDGGFFAALDADSPDGEGAYYTWTHDELSARLPDDLRTRFFAAYGIRPGGTIADETTGAPTGTNLPALGDNVTEADLASLAPARDRLLRARAQRPAPSRDDKVITGWNALAIRALAEASAVLDDPALLERARHARAFIAHHLVVDGILRRSWCAGVAGREAVLEDVAALVLADLALHGATGEDSFRQQAARGIETLLDHYLDRETARFRMTSNREPSLILPACDIFDQGAPSSLGLAVQALTRFGWLADRPDLLDLAGRIITAHQGVLTRIPSAAPTLATAALELQDPARLLAWRTQRTGQDWRVSVRLPAGWSLTSMAALDQDGWAIPSWKADPNAPAGWSFDLAVSEVTMSFSVCTPSGCRPESRIQLRRPDGESVIDLGATPPA